MDGTMDQDQIGILVLKALDGAGAAMGRAVVHDPENPFGGFVGGLAHNLSDQRVKGDYAGGVVASAKELHAMDIHGRQVSPGTAPLVFVFDFHRGTGSCGQGGMTPRTGLDAGFFIGRQDKVVVRQGASFPDVLVQIQDSPGFGGKVGVSREDPAAMLPGADRVFMKPSPYVTVAEGRDQARAASLSGDIRYAPARQRNLPCGRQLTGDGLDLNDEFWGKKPEADRTGGVLPNLQGAVRKTVFATC